MICTNTHPPGLSDYVRVFFSYINCFSYDLYKHKPGLSDYVRVFFSYINCFSYDLYKHPPTRSFRFCESIFFHI